MEMDKGTLGRTIASTTARNLLCAVLLVAGFLGVRTVIGDTIGTVVPGTESAATIDSAAEVRALISDNDCWTGEAPADMQGVFPGHVVVTVRGDVRLGGSVLVGKALEQIFDGRDHGLTVHAFCR